MKNKNKKPLSHLFEKLSFELHDLSEQLKVSSQKVAKIVSLLDKAAEQARKQEHVKVSRR